jgi:hypothetical protein
MRRTQWGLGAILLVAACRSESTADPVVAAAAPEPAAVAEAPPAAVTPEPTPPPAAESQRPADVVEVPRAAEASPPPATVAPKKTCIFEDSQPWPRNESGGLATISYPVSEKEKPFADRVFKDGFPMAPTACMTMDATVGKEVAWFGIARGFKVLHDRDETRVLLENKYFDGLTDTDLLCVSFAGGGDFVAILPGTNYRVQPLGLLRVYGKVVSVKDGVPRVEVEYVRHFAWGRFCFMLVNGTPAGNQEWRKLCKVKDDDMYGRGIDLAYYVDRLGDPKDPASCRAKVPED